MGPLVLLILAGNMGVSMVMANSTVNGTNTASNMTCMSVNGTGNSSSNMSCPMHNNMTAGMTNNTHNNMTGGMTNNMHNNMTGGMTNNTHNNMTGGMTNNTHNNMTGGMTNNTHNNMTGPMPTPTPMPTSPQEESGISLGFSIAQEFTPGLNDTSSLEYQQFASNLTSGLDASFQNVPGYNRSVLTGVRPGSIVVDVKLLFNNASSLPNVSVVTETLVAAVTGGNFSFAVNTSTIKAAVVTPQAATTMAPTTAAKVATAAVTSAANSSSTSSSSSLALSLSLNQTFSSDLLNSSTTTFQSLKTNVESEVGTVLRNENGDNFVDVVVDSFSSGSVVVAMTANFKNSSVVPSTSSVASQLKSGLSNSSLNVITSSITVSQVSNSSSATTAAAAATTASSSSGSSTDPPTSSEGTLGLTFSMDRTFTSDLSNSSSSGFQTLATTTTSTVNTICTTLYSSNFSRSIVNSFTNGSVKTDMTLVFTSKSVVPDATSAASLIGAELLKSNLSVINGSVSVQSTSTSGCHPHPSPFSLLASALAMVAVAQMLVRF